MKNIIIYKYHYLYKTINLISNRYYIGVHETNDLNDGYLGSGLALGRAIKKYGTENFENEILEFFNSSEEAYKKEEKIVNKDFVKDKMTYNLKEGGKGGWNYVNSKEYWDLNREKRSKKLKETHRNNPEIAINIGIKVSEYAKNNPEKIKESNKKATKSRLNNSNFLINVGKGLDAFYKTEEGILEKENKSKKALNYWNNTEKGKLKRKELSINNKGYNNPEFIVLCKEKYESNMINILYFVLFTDLFDYLISERLKLSSKIIHKMLEYYEYLGYINNKQQIYISDAAHKVVVLKTKYDLIDKCLFKENIEFKNYKLLREDYINNFNKSSKFIFDENYSDSYLNNFNFKAIKNYLLYLDIIFIKEIKKINIRSIYPNAQRATGIKTILQINEKFKQEYILIKKNNVIIEYLIEIKKDKNTNYFFILYNKKESMTNG
jgi:hypothetical protein